MRGKPEKDLKEVQSRWESELQEAGLSGTIEVEYNPFEDTTEEWGFGKQMFEALAGGSQMDSEHAYYTEIPGAKWPVKAAVFTTKRGRITFIMYSMLLPKRIAGELEFGNREGTFRVTYLFEGEGADALNDNQELKKTLEKSLSIFYQSTFSTYRIDRASYQLSPTDEGTDVTVTTTLKTPPLGWGKKSFRLKKILAALQALEEAL